MVGNRRQQATGRLMAQGRQPLGAVLPSSEEPGELSQMIVTIKAPQTLSSA